MGKKKGQHQRTKGNVLPSSSVRSADLLTKEGEIAGLGLLHSLPSTGLGNIPELAGLDSISSVEFRTVLKKLYKRDVTTKLKALAELSELCKSCKQHEVLTVLPYWPRVYNRLFEDGDRRVRESSQKAMLAMVSAAGKNLALQLKSIIGCWFVSQCDPYAPSAMAADASFAHAFSGEKKIEAFVFCRAEILRCITSFLFGPQAKREKLPDQEVNNYHRIMASCLEALSLYVLTVLKQKPANEEIEEILNESKFWKLQKHGNSAVRGGFYSTIESLCIVCSDLIDGHLAEVCKSIFHRLDECSVAVCKPLYAAAVAVVVKCDTWHEAVDLHKGVIAGLCNTLKSGCHGLWSFVFPALLPILAKVPNSVDLVMMFTKVFDAMRICMEHEQVKPSKRGSELAITTFIELLRLSVSRVSKEVSDAGAKDSIIHVIIDENVQWIVDDSFTGKSNRSTNRLVFRLISETAHAWEMVNAGTQSDNMFSKLCDSFWKCIRATVDKRAMEESNLTSTYLAIQLLSEMLHFKPPTESKLRRSVKFEGDNQRKDTANKGNVTVDDKVSLPWGSKCLVQNNVNAIVADCLLPLPWKQSSEMLLVYGNVFENLSNRDLFVRICDKFCHEERTDDEVVTCIQGVFIPEIFRITACLTQDCDGPVLLSLSNIIFHAIQHCRNAEAFPIEVSTLIETDISNRTFFLFLHLLAQLVNCAVHDCKIATWVMHLLKDVTKVWNFLETLADNISTCHCSSSEKSKFDFDESWDLLTLILSATFTSREGEEKSLCTQEGFLIIAKKLFTNLELAMTCSECYCLVLMKTANLMLSCVGRRYDVTMVIDQSRNVWVKLMTDLLRSHCVGATSGNALLGCFENFFTLAVQNDTPFNEPDVIDAVLYIAEQVEWMKQTLFDSNADTITKLFPSMKSAITMVLRTAYCQDKVALIILNSLLPNEKQWEKFRDFQLPSASVECGGGGSLDGICEDLFFNHLASALGEIVICIVNAMRGNDSEIVWEDQGNVLMLGREMAVAAMLSGSACIVDNFLSTFSSQFNAKLQCDIMSKCLNQGGIWPRCLKLLASLSGGTDLASTTKHFCDCCKSEEVSLPMFQTMLVVVEFLENRELRNLLKEMLCHIVEADLNNLQSSSIYSFCIGVSALSCLDSESRTELVKTFYETALEWRKEKVDLFLLDGDFDDCTDELTVFNSNVAALFTLAVEYEQESIAEDEWDFIRCALMSWMENFATLLDSDVQKFLSLEPFLTNSCKLLEVVNKFMHSPKAREDPTVPNNLVSEWMDFFLSSINASLVKIFVCLGSVDHPSRVLLRNICRCLAKVAPASIIQCSSDLRPKLSPGSNLPDKVQTILNHLCSMLHASSANSQRQNLVTVTAFQLINTILGELVTPDTSVPPGLIFNVVRKAAKSIQALFEIPEIAVAKAALDAEDSDEDFGEGGLDLNQIDDAFLDGIMDNSSFVLTYLLSWKLLVKLTRHIQSDHKPGYIEALVKGSDLNMSDDLLPKLFKLMVGKKSHFKTDPGMFSGDSVNLDYIQHTAASLYRDFLVQMPAVSRAWFNDLSKAARCRVDRFTSMHVSPVLVEEEFKAVQITKQQQSMGGMEIVARTGAREVHAAYQINEVRMEIAVCLSPNHPLGPITVNTEKRAGVVMGQWRYWLLQITTFLQYQNGGIIDGLLLWKDKVDKRFEGLEECMICFSLAHGSSQSLPKLKCKTCKKKYHAECLYKWFDTSNNSTCPLCRSPMIFR